MTTTDESRAAEPEAPTAPTGAAWTTPEPEPALTIHQRMVLVARDVGAIPKDLKNVDSGYAARGIDDVLDRVHGCLVAHGVALYPHVVDVQWRDVPRKNGGIQHEARIRVRYDFVGPDGDTATVETASEALDSSDKATNKAMSAALKYALLHAFTIPLVGDDADAGTPERAAEPEPDFDAAPRAILDQIIATVFELREAGVEVDAAGWTVLGVELVRGRRAAVDVVTAESLLSRLDSLRPVPSGDGAIAACPTCAEPLIDGVNEPWVWTVEETGEVVEGCAACKPMDVGDGGDDEGRA